MVLLIGFDSDLHLDAAVLELRRRNIAFVRINPERLNRSNTKVTIRVGVNEVSSYIYTDAGIVESSSVTGVWCRYALEAITSKGSDDADRFGDEEFIVSLRGALSQIPAARWVNDPFIEAKADNKPHQLALAVECGLLIPPSIVSQQLTELVQFVETHGRCVIKQLGDIPLLGLENGIVTGSYTSLLDEATLVSKDWDETCPVLLQKCVDKSADVRITVIDDVAIAAKLSQHSSATMEIDFRNAINLCTTEFAVTSEVEGRLLKLIRRLGLRYASCDFCLMDDDLYFLEANVAGNYLWTEHEARLPITAAIVDRLSAF